MAKIMTALAAEHGWMSLRTRHTVLVERAECPLSERILLASSSITAFEPSRWHLYRRPARYARNCQSVGKALYQRTTGSARSC